MTSYVRLLLAMLWLTVVILPHRFRASYGYVPRTGTGGKCLCNRSPSLPVGFSAPPLHPINGIFRAGRHVSNVP
jgi:hypothetical protein